MLIKMSTLHINMEYTQFWRMCFVKSLQSLNFCRLRVANTRRSQLCDTQCRLLLLRRETEDGRTLLQTKRTVCSILVTIKFSSCYQRHTQLVERVYELDFELTTQLGRVRGLNYSLPYLALPWTIIHTINEKSPLYGISPAQWNDPNVREL